MFRAGMQNDAPLSSVERAVHLLNRAAFGPRPGDVERVLELGIAAWVDEQLHPDTIDDRTTDSWDASFKTRTMAPPDLKPTAPIGPGAATSAAILPELRSHKLLRAIRSRRQLQEVLVDFWFNHFNVFWSKGECRYLTTGYERDAIRPNVLGKFKDLLLTVARHPAMLVYLDNALSRASGINENYARELMELHTLGVDGPYTQQDIIEVARCFTGWTVDPRTLQFRFEPEKHDRGSKVVLGHTISGGGPEEGESVLAILAAHPKTARFLATKLVRRFVSDDPPQTLVDRTARMFLETEGDIRETVRVILGSEEFFAPGAFRCKLKPPFELVVSAVRAVDAEPRIPTELPQTSDVLLLERLRYNMLGYGRNAIAPEIQPYISLAGYMERMGQVSYQQEPPTGFPERSSYWLSAVSVLHRLRFAVSLVTNQIPDIIFNPAKVAGYPGGEWESALATVMGHPAVRFVHAAPAADDVTEPDLVSYLALLLGSPDFQHK